MGARIRGMASLRRKLGALAPAELKTVRREVRRALVNVEAGAKTRAPVDQGRLQNSIAHEVARDGLSGRAGTNVEYAPDVEFGTAPHVILPKNKKALAFGPKGAKTVVKRVNHPGTRAQPYLFPAFEEERPKFLRRLADALDDAHREVARER